MTDLDVAQIVSCMMSLFRVTEIVSLMLSACIYAAPLIKDYNSDGMYLYYLMTRI